MTVARYKSIGYKKRKKFKKKKSIFKNRLFRYLILSFVFLGLLSYLLFFSELLKIKRIEILSKLPLDNEFYKEQEIILKKDIGNFLITKLAENIFLLKSEGIKEKLLEEHPELKTLKVRKSLTGKLILEVEQRKAVGIFCFQREDECFLIDDYGIIFQDFGSLKTETINLFAEVIRIFSEEERDKDLGEKVLAEEKLTQFLRIKDDLEKNLEIETAKFILAGQQRTDIETAEGWQIYLDMTGDMKLSLTKLKLLLEKEISAEQRKNLQYIDLRFSKVYYK